MAPNLMNFIGFGVTGVIKPSKFIGRLAPPQSSSDAWPAGDLGGGRGAAPPRDLVLEVSAI